MEDIPYLRYISSLTREGANFCGSRGKNRGR